MTSTTRERLQKVIARAGVASRRGAERLIQEGVVRVNGVIARDLGHKVDPLKDTIEVCGRRIVREKPIYLLLHKPRGTVTTAKDPEGRPTVLELLKTVKQRVFSVGRLDYNTTGAIIVTNDGELSQALGHPSSQVPRSYRVKVSGTVTAEAIEQLRRGVEIGDGLAKAAEVSIIGRTPRSTTISLTINEGRNHQLHRMMEAIGHRVTKLARESFAGLDVEGLKPGEYRELRGRELGKLKRLYLTPYRKRHKRVQSLHDKSHVKK